mmetsp:Transcript_77843/g.137257  ORF Transcript_77843/g.137257 Transcript_77843/m.137257 type:complete len:377 (+) Transcript_77843:57-1187(+)|eukprot:CAMPEP_0197656324 /NCGR_PEP_ID=MMETSP1338-20131121/41316_1 /TAXON_ID=43686 ORGANISM="Pelagodinium beii, Strain RCC1491" /NCGR_SAMPLE_ID=MMETSP1338 /ASSEMBLY_ACC=CAM_ASM_000754 /LENGTH=376 /DNA_ID=CAMNT_0043232273 /DNA_START=57 /DNA_END=1187 /DNA_ORIENTATION=-
MFSSRAVFDSQQIQILEEPTVTKVAVEGPLLDKTTYSGSYLGSDGPVLVREEYPGFWRCSCLNYAFCFTFLALSGVLGFLLFELFGKLNRVTTASSGYQATIESEQGNVGATLGSGSNYDLLVGRSLVDVTKCVTAPVGIVCAGHVEQVGSYMSSPATWKITSSPLNGELKVCVQRTDVNQGWDMNLVIRCSNGQAPSPAPAAGGPTPAPAPVDPNQGYTTLSIGNTLETKKSTKCVGAPTNVHCDDTAEQVGRTGEYTDRFHIYHQGNQICAHRVDHDAEWGLNLVLKCKNTVSDGKHYKTVTIGNTLSNHANVKCVPDPGDVVCDDSAEQVGRTGKYPDKFSIYHEANKICARRTDSTGDWGLNLVLKCEVKTA